MKNKKTTTLRNFRIPDEIWTEFKKLAEENYMNVTQYLIFLVREHLKKQITK